MTEDDLIDEEMRRIAASAHAPDDGLAAIAVNARRRRRTRLAAVAGVSAAACATVVAIGVGALASDPSASSPPPAADNSKSTPVEELTGEAVGDALGLESTTFADAEGCSLFAEYSDPLGFCLDSVDATHVEKLILGRQINGHERTPELEAFITATEALADEVNKPAEEQDRELRHELQAEIQRLIAAGALK